MLPLGGWTTTRTSPGGVPTSVVDSTLPRSLETVRSAARRPLGPEMSRTVSWLDRAMVLFVGFATVRVPLTPVLSPFMIGEGGGLNVTVGSGATRKTGAGGALFWPSLFFTWQADLPGDALCGRGNGSAY